MSNAATLDSITALDDAPRVTLPPTETGTDQDQEWFEVELERGGQTRRMGIHDYASIYSIPGLYESLVYRALECRSPIHVIPPLMAIVEASGSKREDLRLLDLGAGNGVVGALAKQEGAGAVLGLDLLPEAAEAAERDRPGTYQQYVVTDLTTGDLEAQETIRGFRPNALVVVAALGYGDIPPAAFVRAFNFVPRGGWLGMCIKDRFLERDDMSGFGQLVRRMVDDGTVEVLHRDRYVHRRAVAGEPLHYVALVARKQRDLSFIAPAE